MEYRIVIERRARSDVDEIVSYIAGDSPPAAFTWYEDLFGHIASLGHMPRRCAAAPEPELGDLAIRQMIFGNYRILFTVDDHHRSLHIHHVRHGARRGASMNEVLRDDDE